MKKAELGRSLGRMVSGECKWVGKESVHVYCSGRLVSREGVTLVPTNVWQGSLENLRLAPCERPRLPNQYDATDRVFKVVTTARPHAGQDWIDLDDAVTVLESILS
jgi:hypothetical protein